MRWLCPLAYLLRRSSRVAARENAWMLIGTIALVGSTAAQAQLYTWRDNDRRLNVTQTPPPRSCQTADCKKFHAVLDRAESERELELQLAFEKADAERRRQLENTRRQEAAEAREALAKQVRAANLVDAYKLGYASGFKYKSEARRYKSSDRRCSRYVFGGRRKGLDEYEWDRAWEKGCNDGFGDRPSRY